MQPVSKDDLYPDDSPAEVKGRWKPAVCVIGKITQPRQTITDWETVEAKTAAEAVERSRAEAFLIPPGGEMNPDSVELAALAVWGGRDRLRLPDGSIAVSREALSKAPDFERLRPIPPPDRLHATPPLLRHLPAFAGNVYKHLLNAELLSADAWLDHPLRSAGRLIPVAIKERINRSLGRPIFDLTFYIRFEPRSLFWLNTGISLLRYLPAGRSGRHRVAFVTPHLSVGGAEAVLLDIANALDRDQYELFLLATHPSDQSWSDVWSDCVDHVYDLSFLMRPDRSTGGLCSIAANWQMDVVLIQNSLVGYAAIPELRRNLPRAHIVDLIHATHEHEDLIAEVAGHLDGRIVISERARNRLLQFGFAENKIRLIRTGIDLGRFRLCPLRPESASRRILFAARLDAVKRPLLLVEIAAALSRRRGQTDFRIVVAGGGPEEPRLRERVRSAQVEHLFEFLGHVSDMPGVMADADVLILTSINEGTPLAILEAFATGRPAVASNVGAIAEVVDDTNGILIEAGSGEAESFAEALQSLLENPERRWEMGIAGRRKVEAQYDKQLARKAYLELFGTLLSDRRAGEPGSTEAALPDAGAPADRPA